MIMIIIGIVLSFIGLAYLCWLVFALAVHALPAVAGYHAALGLAHIGILAEGWRQAMAMAGAIVVAATSCARMAFSALPPDAGQSIGASLEIA
jgi:hypothetical protein